VIHSCSYKLFGCRQLLAIADRTRRHQNTVWDSW